MFLITRSPGPIVGTVRGAIIDLPAPASLSYFWNMGSLLGLCLVLQLVTGIFLAMHYCPHTSLAFDSIHHILRDVQNGWVLKYAHANGASLFFFLVYAHVARGIYYSSFLKRGLWVVGVVILFVMMATAFIGYVLPWGQMSFWGATVITNFVSAVPYVGPTIVNWLWGGYSVGNPTLNRFLSLHFVMPFVIVALVFLHLIFLHQEGSSTPHGLSAAPDRAPFHPYYTTKDLLGFVVVMIPFAFIVFFAPNSLGDPENFIRADALVTPVHIMPEWYFLFAYAILRSIPSKTGGVVALAAAVAILAICPWTHCSPTRGLSARPLGRILFWSLVANFLLLTWAGSKPVEHPYVPISQVSSFLYFSYFLILSPACGFVEKKLLFPR